MEIRASDDKRSFFILLREYVFIRFKEEKCLSTEVLVTGMVAINTKSLYSQEIFVQVHCLQNIISRSTTSWYYTTATVVTTTMVYQ